MSEPGIGDNSSHRVEPSQLRSFVERIENLISDRTAINDDIKDVKQEAQSAGYTPKVIMALIKERATEKAKLEEFQALLDMYRDNLS